MFQRLRWLCINHTIILVVSCPAIAPSSRQRSEAEESSEPLLVSLARWLEDYISWIDDFDENADLRPLCKNKVGTDSTQNVW